MGLQLNLCKMLGVPDVVDCPKCGKEIRTRFEDYDFECGNPNPNMGEWVLDVYCSECEHEFKIPYYVEVGNP